MRNSNRVFPFAWKIFHMYTFVKASIDISSKNWNLEHDWILLQHCVLIRSGIQLYISSLRKDGKDEIM